MSRLSVNINKVATIRNARGGKIPDVLAFAQAAENFGAEGITIHPRPDERHIRRTDVYALKEVIKTEFNIEGYPSPDFLEMIKEIQPDQVTLVPDAEDVLTSDAGWNCIAEGDRLRDVISEIQAYGSRVSVFLDPDVRQVEAARDTGTNRIELYTEAFASRYPIDAEAAIKAYKETATLASELGLGINAGHDLNLYNLRYFNQQIPNLLEVSIGHALISDALYYGLNNTIQMYLNALA